MNGADVRALDRARLSRDPRFDGKFFIAVTTTGIYCRPICPVRSPKRVNIRYYPTAAAAAEAGFRPCLRCRPEAAPGTAGWLGTSAVVRRALRLIDEGFLDGKSVAVLAAHLGIGARHLHRLFAQHVGASPAIVARTRRVDFAKRLLDDTALPITDIALAAGFGSVRRFNDVFHTVYGRPPRELRKRRAARSSGGSSDPPTRSLDPPARPSDPPARPSDPPARPSDPPARPSDPPAQSSDPPSRSSDPPSRSSDLPARGLNRGEDVTLRLAFRPPYDWTAMREFFAARAIPGVERVDDRGYARTVALERGHACICVRPLGAEHALELRVQGAPPRALLTFSAIVRRMFDLAADPARIALAFKHDALLAPLVRRRPGLRIPGMWDPFECAVRAVIGQQISVAAARTIAARLVARAGAPTVAAADGLTHLFPSPAALASADLNGLGLTTARVTTLRTLAEAVAGGLDLAGTSDEVTRALAALPGIGAWTAAYVALRALGEPDAFPAGDLVLRRIASPHAPLTARALEARAEAWRPWRGYATLHLWRAAASSRESSSSSGEGARERLRTS